jgi:ATP dependent DNA ligase domain
MDQADSSETPKRVRGNAGGNNLQNSPGPAGFIAPCLPTLSRTVPDGPRWAFEIKHDGFRFIVRRDGDRVQVLSRHGKDWTDKVPAIVEALLALPIKSATLDGEGVVVDERGRFLVMLGPGHHGPRHPGELVAKRDRRDLVGLRASSAVSQGRWRERSNARTLTSPIAGTGSGQ